MPDAPASRRPERASLRAHGGGTVPLSTRSEHDVVVMGGGPAGCAAAILLARRSHSVALVRPATPPAGALAESIPPSARRLLDQLGFLPAVDAHGFHPNLGNSVWWADAPARVETFADGAGGFHTDRATLESVLVGAAESLGVTVVDASARDAEETEGRWAVRCDPGGSGDAFTLGAPWVLDATGRHGLLARREGREADRDTTSLALVRRFERDGGWDPTLAGRTMVESHGEGWAWSVPLDERVRCVTAMVDQRHAELAGTDVAALLERELARTAHVGRSLKGAVPVGEAWACPASLYASHRCARAGLFLVGDAASFIDPLSSYGVKKALSSGWLAGVATHTALVDPALAAIAVEYFEARERAVYRSSRRASAGFFAEAAETYGTAYWRSRAEAAHAAGGGPEGVDADPYDQAAPPLAESVVRSAYDEIRERPRLAARRGSSLRAFERPAVRGDRIILTDHLASDTLPSGLRWVRDVDLVALVEIATRHAEVPDGWAEYNALQPPVTLPDYLTALSMAFAAGFLEHADS